jgi:hypothetical protein
MREGRVSLSFSVSKHPRRRHAPFANGAAAGLVETTGMPGDARA